MGKNRDHLGLVAAILQAANGGATKTRIMLDANLSFKLLEKYLYSAMMLGFIQQIETRYSLTLKGREFLRKYKNLQQEHSTTIKTLKELRHRRTLLDRQCQETLSEIQIKPKHFAKLRNKLTPHS